MSAGDNETPAKMVGALVAGIKVIRYLSDSREAKGVSQIARDLDINPSTCFNILRTLVWENLLDFDARKKTYFIGMGMLELTKGLKDSESFMYILLPHLEALAEKHQVTTTLWRKMGQHRVVLVQRADAQSAVRIHMSIGQRMPLYLSALGRGMAAFSGLDVDQLREQFDKLRWQDAPKFADYWADVQKAKSDGYAIDQDAYVKGVTSISAPIVNSQGEAFMAISMTGFTSQFTPETLKAAAVDLKDVAHRASMS